MQRSQDKVLIIEDTRSFALMLSKLLHESNNIESDIAYSRLEAEALLGKNSDRYFAAIVDLNLPDAHNGEATDIVVAKNIPALVFTGTKDENLKENLWARGIADYAHKASAHSLEYISWIVSRIQKNSAVHILIIDSDKSARKSMTTRLKTHRYNVHVAHNSDDALALLEKNTNISLVILDAFIGREDGFELASKIRDRYTRENLEIIGMSSQEGRSFSAQFIKSGADDFLLKPFIPEEFLCRVNHAVDRVESYKKLNELNQIKNQLLGTAAHDIRGPVAAMKTAADYIIRSNPPENRRQALINMIQSSSSNLLSLLSDLLDVSAIESGELKLNYAEEDLGEMLSERCLLYKAEADAKEITVSTSIGANSKLYCDAIKIRQVIDNLLTNAIKYSPLGGNIDVCLKITSDAAELSFSDSGPGIPEKAHKDLFSPFKTLGSVTTAGEKATGLGLSIVNSVIQAHEGRIDYTTSDYGGAQFTVYLPHKA